MMGLKVNLADQTVQLGKQIWTIPIILKKKKCLEKAGILPGKADRFSITCPEKGGYLELYLVGMS